MSQKEFIKRIPERFQDALGLKRFKISLIKCENKIQRRKVSNFLDYKVNTIFNNIQDYDKDKSKHYLKTSIQQYLLELDNIDLNKLNKTINKNMNKVTFKVLLDEAISQKNIEHKNKLRELKKTGVDINIKNKKSSTVQQYEAISNHVYEFFGKDLDIADLNRSVINSFRNNLMDKDVSNNSINIYISQLKTIFKNHIINNELDIKNPFDNFKTLMVTKNKKMFTIKEIDRTKEILNNEQYFVFKYLLKSGMRYEELMTIKKKDVKNNSFYFFDSKDYFEKVVPIHKDNLLEVQNKLEKINDNDYLFYTNIPKNRIANTRISFNKILKEAFDKTLHKTRTTFITYLNYFNENFNDKDIKSLTHKLVGVDDKSYVVTRNIKNLKNIIDSVDLNKLVEIEKAL